MAERPARDLLAKVGYGGDILWSTKSQPAGWEVSGALWCAVLKMETNRDLYIAIVALRAGPGHERLTLEVYLRTLWHLASGNRHRQALSLDEFWALLTGALSQSPPPFDEIWRARFAEDAAELPGFPGWESRILRQIVDLHEMAEQDVLGNSFIYLGTNSPRGSRWYNFDPDTFLECATASYFRGFTLDEDTDDRSTPDLVIDRGDDEPLRDFDRTTALDRLVVIRYVTWNDFRDFLGCGQWYE